MNKKLEKMTIAVGLTKISHKFLVTIPKTVRENLDLKEGEHIIWWIEKKLDAKEAKIYIERAEKRMEA